MKTFVSALVVLASMVFSAGVAISGNADLEKDLVGSVRRSMKVIEKAQEKLFQGLPIKAEMTQLRSEAEGIRASNLLLEEHFRARGQKAGELGGKARQRQEEMETRYREVLRQLQSLLDELAADGSVSSATLESLQELFKQVAPEKKYPLLGSLPYSHLGYPAQEPLKEPQVVPAYRGGSTASTVADTQGTAVAPITPEIAELAQSLDWNPVRIYEWVQENVETEWYWGSMKGALETLHQRSGNDADQAALLVALLRSASFPARYVRGVIEFFPGIDKAKSLTGLDDPLKIAHFFQKAGIPFEPVIVGGKIANFRLEHIWVETEVPYANYRGALRDNMGRTWIALDTHLKPAGYQWNAAEDFGADFDLAALPEDYLSLFRSETPLEYLRGVFTQYLEGNFATTTFQDHLRTHTLKYAPQGILPASLQFRSTAITGEYVELPVNLRHQVAFAAATDGSELFNITFDAASLSNRSVCLSYEPETVEDQQIIDSYGGLDNTPSYLVRLRPVLKIDRERKVVGRDGLPMGADYTLTIGFLSPNGRQEVIGHHVVGNLASLGIVSQKVVPPEDLPPAEKDAERLLHESALSYIERWSAAEEELAALLKVTIVRPLPTIASVGGVVDVAYLLGMPQGFDWKGAFIDAGFRRIETVASPAQEERAREFMRLSALEGSILENRVFEDDLGVASVSTAKLLALAPQSLTLDSTNADTLLPTLALGENVKTDILNAVHQGLRVTLPEGELSYKNWTGIGYIKENPVTGEAGYMLSGMIAGGMTAEEWADQILRERFEKAYSQPPNDDPSAAARIIMIPVGDRQNGVVGEDVEEPLAVLVVDLDGRPVVGAEVTFSALAGGGNFAGAATVQVATGGNGIAKVSPILGTLTKDNPSYLKANQSDTYLTQVGVNLFSATVSSQYGMLSLAKPFEVFGQPDLPFSMEKVVGDGNWSMANNSAGTIKVLVVDQYQNPVSNVPVTFQAESATSMSSVTALPPNYRSVTFYESKECTNEYPLYGECSSSSSITRKTAHFGVGVDAILGNTVNTRYAVTANTPGVPAQTFTLYSGGYWEEGRYIPPQLFIRYLSRINDQGAEVNAAKVGEPLKAPLVATMILMRSDYTMVGPTTCTKYDSKGQPYQTDCWTVKGSGLVNTERIKDGTVRFTPVSGGGSVASVENLGDGSYQTGYTTGATPSLNQIEAVGEAAVTVPEVFSTYYQAPIETGYTVGSLPLRTVTLKSGQKGLFNRTTKDLLSQSEQKIAYEAYGVDVKTEVSPKVLFLGEENMSRSDLAVNYTILPDGESPVGYEALSAEVDLSSVGLSGGTQWKGYLVGSSVKGAGDAVFSYGTEFDLQKTYSVRPVLNRGGDIEIRGEEVALKVVSVDLDIDSDNNAGFQPDGTHNDPQRGQMEDLVEDLAGAPGKIIRPNLLDVDGDKIPGYADGINIHGNEGDGACAPFVPLLLEVAGNVDPSKTKVRFIYFASDPAGVTKVTDDEGRDVYAPTAGSLRIWMKDGGESRNVASLKIGGDFVTPGEAYSLAALGPKTADGGWKFWIEGIKDTTTAEEGRIKIEIDVEGTGETYYQGDAVQTTVRNFALIPDYNHNRQIDEEDRQRALAGDTYYFWLNDDDDQGETEGGDIPGDTSLFGKLDWEDNAIDGVRDLIDFFPVSLDIQDLVTIYPPDKYNYGFKIDQGQVNLAIPPVEVNNAGDYLTDPSIARGLAGAMVWPINDQGISLNSLNSDKAPPILEKIGADANTGIILLEGAQRNFVEGDPSNKAPLVLSITEKASGNQIFQLNLNLSLDGVEQMFRHKNLIRYGAADAQPPEHNTIWGEPDRFVVDNEEPANCPDQECLDSKGDNFVFVHGYNVDGQQARGWQSEMFKRMYWSGSTARFWGVSWYGSKTQILDAVTVNYHVNVIHAFNTVPKFREFLNTISGTTTVAAHSLGNMLVSACLSDSLWHADINSSENITADIRNYFMIDAAVALEAYISGSADSILSANNPMIHPDWYGYKKELTASEWYTLFPTEDHRSDLTWRNRFENLPEEINYFNFYSSGEEVLDTHPSNNNPALLDIVASGAGRYAWALQEKLKGRMLTGWVLGSNYGGWSINIDDYFDKQHYDNNNEEKIRMKPSDANAIDQTFLNTKSFFSKFKLTDLLDPGVGSDYAKTNRTKLLAEAFPSLTLPAGGPEGGQLGLYEIIDEGMAIDMQAEFGTNDWPKIRKDKNDMDWKHSDLRNVGYLFIYKIFNEFTNVMGY